MYGCPALIAENGLVILFMQCNFDYIPPIWPEELGKQQKRMHFNFQVDDLPAAVEEAIKLGATKAIAQYGETGGASVLPVQKVSEQLCQW